MPRLVPVALAVILTVYAVVEIAQAPGWAVRRLPKAMWFVIALVPVLGPVTWFLFGRPTTGGGSGRSRPSPRPRGPLGPDDDPDFLRKL